MVEAVVSFALQKIDQLLLVEGKLLLSGVRREVGEIRDELDSMRDFLRDADAREGRDEAGVKVWVKQVREIAYDVEDVLDEFELLLNRPHRRGFRGFLHKLRHSFKHQKANRRIAREVESIKTRVLTVSERSQRYHFDSSTHVASIRWHDPRGDALLIEEDDLVGIDKPRNELIGWLVKGESRLGVVSVEGMAGLGKTTLVKKVYDHNTLKGYFQHHAWIVVSQSFQIEQILTDMIVQLFEESNQPLPQRLDTMKDAKLKESLKEFLQNKRYLIVFDDVWSTQAWEAVRYALPNNNCGSRIMVTTRFADIASFCIESYGHVHKLKPLQIEQATALFYRMSFRSNLENTIPPDLEQISLQIMRKCEGLPLAIVAIGGLLSTKHRTMTEWQKVHHSLGAELESNEKLTSMKKIFLLSYFDLPYYLKSCFLYLSIFPDDYSIRCTRVIRLWAAEGFVEERNGSSLEDVAEGYLNELINRNLVQVALVDFSGRVRKVRVHDVMRELIVSKAREQSFATLVAEQNTVVQEKIRRLSIQSCGENVTKNKSLPHLRSLLMFRMERLHNSSIPAFHCGCRLLRVLDLEGALLEAFPSELVNLPLLRYLSLRNTNIELVSNSIGKLQNLQTLDLKGTYVSELPIEILKLQKLHHLLLYRYVGLNYFDFVKGFKAPVGIGSLAALQKLSFIEANSNTIKELGRLKQLRRLGVRKLRKEQGIELCSSIEKMSNLRSLDITSIEKEELIDLESPLSSPPLHLERLSMRGRLEKLPHWIPSLLNLVTVRLIGSVLRNDPLQALQDLPNLVLLELFNAFEGEHLCFQAKKFQTLKILRLYKLDGLKLVRMEEGALLHLQRLYIWSCRALENVPLGIEHLTNLKQLSFSNMSSEFRTRLSQEGEDYWRIAHIPRIRQL